MKLLDKLQMGWSLQEPRGLCSGGSPPDYDNERLGGGTAAGGLRVPQEMGPATLLVKKQVDLGSVSGTVTLLPSQAMASLITATPTAATTLVWAGCYPGLVLQVQNNAAATYAITCEIKGNATNTVVVPAGATVQIMHSDLLSVPTGGIIPGGGSVSYNTYAGATDAVTFGAQVNVAIFTSTTPDAATLATPAAGDAGKVLILVNTNTTQNAVTTAANKILNGTASTYDTLTAPAHAGAVAVLVASSGFWNAEVFGTGTWVLSEV